MGKSEMFVKPVDEKCYEYLGDIQYSTTDIPIEEVYQLSKNLPRPTAQLEFTCYPADVRRCFYGFRTLFGAIHSFFNKGRELDFKVNVGDEYYIYYTGKVRSGNITFDSGIITFSSIVVENITNVRVVGE